MGRQQLLVIQQVGDQHGRVVQFLLPHQQADPGQAHVKVIRQVGQHGFQRARRLVQPPGRDQQAGEGMAREEALRVQFQRAPQEFLRLFHRTALEQHRAEPRIRRGVALLFEAACEKVFGQIQLAAPQADRAPQIVGERMLRIAAQHFFGVLFTKGRHIQRVVKAQQVFTHRMQVPVEREGAQEAVPRERIILGTIVPQDVAAHHVHQVMLALARRAAERGIDAAFQLRILAGLQQDLSQQAPQADVARAGRNGRVEDLARLIPFAVQDQQRRLVPDQIFLRHLVFFGQVHPKARFRQVAAFDRDARLVEQRERVFIVQIQQQVEMPVRVVKLVRVDVPRDGLNQLALLVPQGRHRIGAKASGGHHQVPVAHALVP
ncbi:MAG: hypothetical protein BWX70_03466 [Verrucomicrobia bacterium ADurb.Bin070]|nr:MAG: hypothetical protein BWX70_03466 [Verrucomicrobia bacterium ADurb.Bin070]